MALTYRTQLEVSVVSYIHEGTHTLNSFVPSCSKSTVVTSCQRSPKAADPTLIA